jgi:hypothetical protein
MQLNSQRLSSIVLILPISALVVYWAVEDSVATSESPSSSTNVLPSGGKCENNNTLIAIIAMPYGRMLVTVAKALIFKIPKLTALQKKVRCGFPISARELKTKPNRPSVARRAIFSTRVIALRASARWEDGHISVITPLAAGAEPEPKGRR